MTYEVRIQSWVRHVWNTTKEIDDSVLVSFHVDTNSANMTDPTLYTYLVPFSAHAHDGEDGDEDPDHRQRDEHGEQHEQGQHRQVKVTNQGHEPRSRGATAIQPE